MIPIFVFYHIKLMLKIIQEWGPRLFICKLPKAEMDSFAYLADEQLEQIIFNTASIAFITQNKITFA